MGRFRRAQIYRISFQTSKEGVVKVNRFWFVKGEKSKNKEVGSAALPWLWLLRALADTVQTMARRVLQRFNPW